MSRAIADSTAAQREQVNRRLAVGLFLSMLVHALLLSLQFGIPGMAMGELSRIAVRLAPSTGLAPVEQTAATATAGLPAAPLPTLEHAAPAAGLRLLDPVPSPQPQPAGPAVRRPARPGKRVSRELPHKPRETLAERVIAQEKTAEPEFSVPQPEPEAAIEKTADPIAVRDGTDQGTGAVATNNEALVQDDGAARKQAAAAEETRLAEERERLAVARRNAEEMAQRQAQEQRLAEERARMEQQRQQAQALQQEQQRLAEQAALEQARQQAMDEEQARKLAQAQQAVREQQERQLAAQEQARQLAQQREEELRRQQQRAQELAAQRKAEDEVRAQAELRQRELERLAARQTEEAAAQRQAAELAARQQAEQVAAQRRADEAARAQAEQLAEQRRLEQLARQQAQQLAEGTRAVTAAAPAGTGGADGGGAGPARSLDGSALASRARELVRGLDVLGGMPPVARPAGDEQRRRRLLSRGAERDVPLRLYIDSFRQKIERNGTLNGAQLASDRVRVDPVVSVAVRSDGSVEDVMIVRSSGHPELDAAVRRIVRLNARYAAFPPNVAAQYDVIEIRRIWTFAEGLKLLEEIR